MNLSKAKTVLIYTFLALNIFLCYQLWQDQGYDGFASFGRKEEISRLESALQTAGLSLEIDLPKATEPLAYMIVEPWVYLPQEIIASFWQVLGGAGEPFPEINHRPGADGAEVYSFGRHELIIGQTGTATINFPLREGDEKEQLEGENLAWQLINNLAFLQDFVFDYKYSPEEAVLIFLRQEYDNYPLYAGYFHFSSADGQQTAELYRLEVLGFAAQEREIISSSMALLRFLEIYEGSEKGISIAEFSLGYYTRGYDAERWEIPPVWRIHLSNGELYYINAFTGNEEI